MSRLVAVESSHERSVVRETVIVRQQGEGQSRSAVFAFHRVLFLLAQELVLYVRFIPLPSARFWSRSRLLSVGQVTLSSLPLSKSFVKARQREPILHLVISHPLHSLSTVLGRDIHRLNHRHQVLLRRQLQHRQNLRPTPNVTRSNTATIRHEGLRLELRQRLIRQTDLMERSIDFADGEVLSDVELVRHIGCVEHEVESEGEVLGPVLVLVADEVLCAELEGVVFLVGRVGDDCDFGAEGVGPDDCEVAETA